MAWNGKRQWEMEIRNVLLSVVVVVVVVAPAEWTLCRTWGRRVMKSSQLLRVWRNVVEPVHCSNPSDICGGYIVLPCLTRDCRLLSTTFVLLLTNRGIASLPGIVFSKFHLEVTCSMCMLLIKILFAETFHWQWKKMEKELLILLRCKHVELEYDLTLLIGFIL